MSARIDLHDALEALNAPRPAPRRRAPLSVVYRYEPPRAPAPGFWAAATARLVCAAVIVGVAIAGFGAAAGSVAASPLS